MTKITFLGTGTSQGVPMIGCHCEVCSSSNKKDTRLRSSVSIEENGVRLIIDSGPDFRYQMLRSKIEDIDAILFTHAHKDHTAGLDDVRAYNYILKRNIDIYAEKTCMNVIMKDFDYAFSEFKYPGVPEITPHLIGIEPFEVKGVKVTPIRGLHHKMGVLGFKIGDIAYLTDMNFIADSELEKIKGINTLIITALRHEPHLSHFTLNESIEISKKIGAKHTYFTHISHQLGLHDTIEKTLPKDMHLGYDRMVLEIL